MTHTWNELESASLGGDRSLQQWLGGNERGAFFRTTSQSQEPRALVKLIPEELADAETQLALWRRTRHLHHPNLLPLLEYGRTDMAGEGYLYAVFEHPDDRLETAIGQGPLGESEVREVLGAVIGALRYLHAQGLMHGALDADHVVAVGNSTKLTTDSLQELGDRGHAEDVRALGALVYELLTGKKVAQGEAPDLSEIAEPFCTIIQRAAEPDLRYRWTLAEIVFALKNSAQEAPAPAVAEPAPLQVSLSPVPDTLADTAEPAPATERTWPRAKMPALLPRWIYFGVGALLLLIVVLNLNRRAGSETHRLPVPVPRVASGPPAQPVFRQPESPVTLPVTTPAATAVPAPAGRPLWRVIAYAYTSSPPAEKKAADINQKRPDLQAQVFHPAGRKSMYLVALGGRMTRSEALKLRRRARAEGLPRDIYIQNFLD